MQKRQRIPSPEPTPPQQPTPNALSVDPPELSDEIAIENVHLEGYFAAGISATNITFRQAAISSSRFTGANLPKAHIIDTTFRSCDLANIILQTSTLKRIAISDCRLTGLSSAESHWEDISIVNCQAELLNLSGSTLKRVTFTKCNLTDADFYETAMTDVRFIDCTVTRARFAQSKSIRTDFRTSNIEGIQIGPRELQGTIVEPSQAPILVAALGVSVRSPGVD